MGQYLGGYHPRLGLCPRPYCGGYRLVALRRMIAALDGVAPNAAK
jgi:hypothetical protein